MEATQEGATRLQRAAEAEAEGAELAAMADALSERNRRVAQLEAMLWEAQVGSLHPRPCAAHL